MDKRKEAVEETRRSIVDATVALHAEQGILATSWEDIARKADVALVLSQLGFGNCLRKRLRLLPFFRSVDVGGWQPWDENGMWSGWKGKNETSWND